MNLDKALKEVETHVKSKITYAQSDLVHLRARRARLDKRIDNCEKDLTVLKNPNLMSSLKEKAEKVMSRALEEGLTFDVPNNDGCRYGSTHNIYFNGSYKKGEVAVELKCSLLIRADEDMVTLECNATLPPTGGYYYGRTMEVFRITSGQNFLFKNKILQYLMDKAGGTPK